MLVPLFLDGMKILPKKFSPQCLVALPHLSKIFILTAYVLLAGCSTLSDGKFVSRDGKTSPFQADKQLPYELPSDPTRRY